ncbi:probable bifunctional methylenetetrahydrofolate dehydrogenase/cyclohydrolase 2 [Thamnophis elegans]|uniref:probable bifunctional methylenetetrahydrofolate dehydrogenase/cyclohydrolase 2 n=1 Tax=Thamnophis elegans TaxID=35005 RepID=UPI00137825C6|nr:probable bifunctional methylenetetrahydrofolate dehydrogenase/cyclohydrolase 2 [Thamnophis elegans]
MHAPLTPYDPVTEHWDSYMLRFNWFLKVNNLIGLSEGCKKNMFLGYCGQEVFETAKDLSEPTLLQLVAWSMLQQTLRTLYTPKPSRHIHRHEFNIRNQKEGKSINESIREKRFHLRNSGFSASPMPLKLIYFMNQRDAVKNEATIISGRRLAAQVFEEIQRDIESWLTLGHKRPHLTVVLVGENPASHTYVRNKVKAAAAVGICSEIILRPKEISQEELLDLTGKLNKNSRVSGILVQLPLPDHIDERTVCNSVAPEKDVDGFHIFNIGRLCLDQPSIIPATAAAVWEIIKRTGIQTFGRNVVVVGRSKNVGMPISMLLHSDGEHERPGGDATVTITHRYTPKDQLMIHTQLADIVIVAAGIPKLITSDMIKRGAAVIDVGINHIHDPVTGKTKLVGDVDFEEVKKKASFITPVPGGVGPMTVAMLLKNTLIAAKKFIY